MQGRDISGPTASIMSSTCWDQQPFMGGVAINFKFKPVGEATRSSMKAVIRTALDQGGLQLQVTCVSKETLLRRGNTRRTWDLPGADRRVQRFLHAAVAGDAG